MRFHRIVALFVGGLATPMFGQSTDPTQRPSDPSASTVKLQAVPATNRATSPPAAESRASTAGTAEMAPWARFLRTDAVPFAPAAGDRVSVLVHMDPRADLITRPEVRAFARARGALVKYEYEILPNVLNIREFPGGELGVLSRLPGVAKVEEDAEVHAMLNDSTPLIRSLQSQIAGAGLSAAGAGTRICIIDTGIDSDSVMYASRIDAAAGWDFVNDDADPEDDYGHGSHVAGIAAGGTGISFDFSCPDAGPEPVQGVAPDATLIGVKVLGARGTGRTSDVLAGVNRCASRSLPGGRADVMNLSLGGGQFQGTCDSDTLAAACNLAVTAGVVVVAAAGNEGLADAVGSPACGSKVLAVAATYDDDFPNCDFPDQGWFGFQGICEDYLPVVDQRCCFSNRGSKIDVAAPGCIVFSDDASAATGDGLIGACGTSMASPQVAGLAALILGEQPALTPAQVQAYIRNGAIDLGPTGFDPSFGYGRIDVINSLRLAIGADCATNADCDDGNGCTDDVCNAGACAHSRSNIDCDDHSSCTIDACSPATGACVHTPIDCDDLNGCTTDDCDPATGCVNTWPECGAAEGCCPPACTSAGDPDCCTLVCPPESAAEEEPDCGIPIDTVNGGCNLDPPVFLPIACGQTYCGTAASLGYFRDTDWYEITVDDWTTFTWSVTAEFNSGIGLIRTFPRGGSDCRFVGPILDPGLIGDRCAQETVPTTCFPPGTYWWFVAPDFEPEAPCGAQYTATLSCAPCSTLACCMRDGSCGDLSPAQCQSQGGQSQGEGTSCQDPSVTCPVTTFPCCFPDGTCSDESRRRQCRRAGGRPLERGTSCGTIECPTRLVACCLVDGTCTDSTPRACSLAGGTPGEVGTSCSGVRCAP